MAAYVDVDAKQSDSDLTSKVRVAVRVAALDIAKRTVQYIGDQANPLFPSVQHRIWARAVLFNADNEAKKALTYLLTDNRDIADLNTLNTYADTVVQNAVNGVIEYLVIAQSDRV